MRRGTTPTHIFTLPFDTGMVANVRITYTQNGRVVLNKTKEDASLIGKTITLKLTQADTLSFSDRSNVEIQLKVKTTEGKVLVSDIWNVCPLRVLDEEEL